MPSLGSRQRGALLGLAVGDAVGTTVEFKPRGTFSPVSDMTGGGPFALRAGEWTDDTSMALCLGRSLMDCGGFDPEDQMSRYLRWRDTGYLSSNGRCFDIGGTVSAALGRFERTGAPFAGSVHEQSAGNGSLMRLAPVALFFADDRELAVEHAAKSSRTTHGATEAVDACRLLAAMLVRALVGEPKDTVLGSDGPETFNPPLAPKIAGIAAGSWRRKREDEIRGTGYAVDALEAAIWCVANTRDYRDAVLRAANLGDDADTTAAIAGQLAGAMYGDEAIPAPWRDKLVLGEEIARLSEALGRVRSTQLAPLSRTYWENPGVLLAGAYPGDLDRDRGTSNVRALLAAGIRRFANLMEEHETDRQGRVFEIYEDIVERQAAALGVAAECRRFPIVDLGVPRDEDMDAIQSWIDDGIDSGQPVYVHCWGGRGRTGTAVGVHLIRHGQADPSDFVDVISARRKKDAGGGRSPETSSQIEFVRRYILSTGTDQVAPAQGRIRPIVER